MAILDQSKLPMMQKQNSDSSELPAGISRGGVNGDTKLVSCPGKGGPARPPSTHARKTTTTQPTGFNVKTMEKVTFSCQDIREKRKFVSKNGLLRNDNYKEVMNVYVQIASSYVSL